MDILNGLNDTQQTNNSFHLDKEERDLEEALRSVDVRVLPKPDAKTQAMFQKAAAHFAQQEAKE